ncbi:MAG: hypothetical protein AAGC95_03280 [Pseudomonadota bacterium]
MPAQLWSRAEEAGGSPQSFNAAHWRDRLMRPLTRDYGALVAMGLALALAAPMAFLGAMTPVLSFSAAIDGDVFPFLADVWAWAGGQTPHMDRASDFGAFYLLLGLAGVEATGPTAKAVLIAHTLAALGLIWPLLILSARRFSTVIAVLVAMLACAPVIAAAFAGEGPAGVAWGLCLIVLVAAFFPARDGAAPAPHRLDGALTGLALFLLLHTSFPGFLAALAALAMGAAYGRRAILFVVSAAVVFCLGVASIEAAFFGFHATYLKAVMAGPLIQAPGMPAGEVLVALIAAAVLATTQARLKPDVALWRPVGLLILASFLIAAALGATPTQGLALAVLALSGELIAAARLHLNYDRAAAAPVALALGVAALGGARLDGVETATQGIMAAIQDAPTVIHELDVYAAAPREDLTLWVREGRFSPAEIEAYGLLTPVNTIGVHIAGAQAIRPYTKLGARPYILDGFDSAALLARARPSAAPRWTGAHMADSVLDEADVILVPRFVSKATPNGETARDIFGARLTREFEPGPDTPFWEIWVRPNYL